MSLNALPSLLAQNIYYINKQIVDNLDRLAYLKSLDPQEFVYEGSPYYNENFVKGDLYYGKNWRYPDVLLRYNIFNDEIEFLLEDKDQVYAIVPEKQITKIVMREDTFVVAEAPEGAQLVSGFYKKLAGGKVDLLAKMHVTFREKQPDKGFVKPDPAKFMRMKDLYYLHKENEDVYRVSNIKKAIEYIGEKEDELEKFAKKEKISAGNESDLIKFMAYYYSLVSGKDSDSDAGM